MHKKHLLIPILLMFTGMSASMADIILPNFNDIVVIDDQIEDQLNKKDEEELNSNAEILNEKITFTKTNSCESIEKIMTDFLEVYRELNPKRTYNRNNIFVDFLAVNKSMDEEIVYKTSEAAVFNDAVQSAESPSSYTISDYSTTNIQKAWVDEPEILKSNGEYLFYYAQESYNNWYISIIKNPTNDDLSDAQIAAKIKIPSELSNIQLFLNWNKLVILASRYSSNYNSVLWDQRSLVIIYDISDLNNLVLEKLTEVYWYFEDARMIWDQLYLVSSINLSRYNIARRDEPVVFNEFQPKLTDISLKSSAKNASWININSYSKKVSTLPCNSIFYLLPSEDTMRETGIYPSFTLISQFSLSDLSKSPSQSLIFWNVDEIHMSQSSLYLPAPIYFSRPTTCSLRWCINSRSYRNENTLVHKFNLWKNIEYQDSIIIPWEPLNQYSMDEDDDWNFRILTTTWYQKQATHLTILDKDLKLKGFLMNIEPWENFKSSRYIWDKLYLVTYQSIDPLFVIDMEDPSNPTIIWELKIPGYSTYLHPYASAKNWIQYLIWLWMSTTDNWYGWLTTDNIKVDLYEINYKEHETAETKCSSLITKNVDASKTTSCTTTNNYKECNEEQRLYEECLTEVNPDNIAVSVIASHEFTWDYSDSPALYNPRTFVWKSNNQELILPITIRTTLEQWTRENNWNYKYNTFVWIKWLSIKTSTALIKEFLSQNFADTTKSDYYYRDFNNARVGYVNNIYYFINKWFIAFIKWNKIATIWNIQ